ncbi:RNA-directed DNA polymerase, eukaryota, partial [Tanacetum coccineum]
MGDQRSKEDDVRMISTSIFVTNFPEHTNVKELWRVCCQYGNVIDSFIPNKRSKNGRFKLYANVARFNRPPLNKDHQSHANAHVKSSINVPAFNRVNSWFSSIQHASDSFSIDEPVAWINVKGVPLKVWSRNTFVKISSKWGSLLYEEDEDAPYFHRKRLCIKTTSNENIFESFKIVVKGKIFWIRVKEVSGWALNFSDSQDDSSESDNEIINDNSKDGYSEKASEAEEIPETIFEAKEPTKINGSVTKEKGDPKYPSGFSPHNPDGSVKKHVSPVQDHSYKAGNKEDVCISANSGSFKQVNTPKTGGSMLQLIKDLIKVGQTMGYKMEGCINDIEEIVKKQGEQSLINEYFETKMKHVNLLDIRSYWGNFTFNFVVDPSVGNYGGILCVWDPNMFHKENSTVSDYFIDTWGKWLPNDKNFIIISVYASQELSEKKMIWQYLVHVIGGWNGDVIIMEDFNEVCTKAERFGSTFNTRGAAAFNSFISTDGLVEVPSDG